MREGWEIKKLGEICDVSAGQGAPQGNDKYSPTGTPFVKAGDLSGLLQGQTEKDILQVSADIIKSHRLKVYPAGALLFAKSGMSCMKGYVYTLKNPCCVVSHLAVLTPKRGGSSYLQYCLRHIKPNTLVKDPAYPSISLADISSMCIPVPPVQEQEKIVAELDCLSGIIEKKKQQLKELDNLAQSIFYDMFGDPIANEKGWETSNIGSFCTDVRYGTSRPACDGGKYAYLRMGNLTYEGNIDLTDIKRIDIPDTEIEKCIVRKGDVLFNRTNSLDLVGKTCLFDLDEEMVIAGYIIRVRLNRSVLPVYLVRTLNTSRYKRVFRTLAKGAVNQANINAKEFQSVVVPVPPLALQNAFAQKMEAIEKQKELIKKSIQETETLFNSRMDYWFN